MIVLSASMDHLELGLEEQTELYRMCHLLSAFDASLTCAGVVRISLILVRRPLTVDENRTYLPDTTQEATLELFSLEHPAEG